MNTEVKLEQVRDAIQSYKDNPNKENANYCIVGMSLLDLDDYKIAMREFLALENLHDYTKREVQALVDKKRKDAAAEAEVDPADLDVGEMVDYLLSNRHYMTLNTDNRLMRYQAGVYRAEMYKETRKDIIRLRGVKKRSRYVSDVENLIKDITACETPYHPDWINLKNGRLCLQTWELLPHTPEHKSIIQIPVDYNPDATCHEFEKWLSDVQPNVENQRLLLQLIGYSMLQDCRFGKMAMLVGPTSTGKSTFLEIVERILGEDNVSGVSLADLDDTQNRFASSRLCNKLANICADVSKSQLQASGALKMISAGDRMSVEKKGLDLFEARLFSTLWASANELPTSRDKTDAWLHRLVIIPFEHQHLGLNTDPDVLDKITTKTELSGILTLVLMQLRELIANGGFRDTEQTRDARSQYNLDNDHVLEFLTEHCEKDEKCQIREKDLYRIYKEWCEDVGVKSLTQKMLREGVKRHFGIERSKLGRRHEKREFFFVGITLSNDAGVHSGVHSGVHDGVHI